MKLKNILLIMAISSGTAIASVWGFGKFYQGKGDNLQEPGKMPVNYAAFYEGGEKVQGGIPIDFTAAASSATPAVVHIKTKINARTVSNSNGNGQRRNPFSDLFGDDIFGDMFGQRGPQVIPEQRASGSGVILTDDGYIVTNNHVIENADEINVTLNNKQIYKAELVGTDPSSDLAVLKIAGTNLPYMVLGNSDEVKLGQWCLAIGYPLTLDVTVTAGIISAKARNIGINARKSNSPIESFIQTDAAVNPGNSGGALVDTDGRLIGINSAIASPTGSYAGYSYAIPVNIVKKIVGDLKKYGAVQRAYLNLSYPNENLSDEQKKELGIKDGEGVHVMDVANEGAAKNAGIKKDDIVTAINGVKVATSSEMIEQIANYKPGDKITVGYKRDGKDYTVNATLTNKSGTYEIVKNDNAANLNDKLGGELETFDKKKAAAVGVDGGVLVKKITGGALRTSKIQEGFVITEANGMTVTSIETLKAALNSSQGAVRLKGVYPPEAYVYGYTLSLGNLGDEQTP
ncbi:MAG: trypsin-like peptidase domain-containing protein [Chitinophagaceae bacterium]